MAAMAETQLHTHMASGEQFQLQISEAFDSHLRRSGAVRNMERKQPNNGMRHATIGIWRRKDKFYFSKLGRLVHPE